jgi:uncharacterized membrane protein YgcG
MEQGGSGGLDTIMRGNPEPSPEEYAHRRRAERRLDRRLLVPALVVSALVHVLLLQVSLESDPDRLAPPPPRYLEVERVMRAFDITAVTADVPPIDVQVRDREVQREVEALDAPWSVPPLSQALPPEAASIRERLRYRMGAAEVWRPPVERQGDVMTADDVVRARVAAELRQFNDSIAEVEAARARALDWSVADSEGRRWGVAPGRIYMGRDTVRIPFAIEFGSPPGRREEERARIRDWREIQTQAARIETQEAIDARIRAIRQRAEEERARSSGPGSGGGGGGGGTAGPGGGGATGGGGGAGGR